MFKYILENAGDIQWLALVPLVLFFLVFVGAMITTMLKNKSYIERMSNLPFEGNISQNAETKKS